MFKIQVGEPAEWRRVVYGPAQPWRHHRGRRVANGERQCGCRTHRREAHKRPGQSGDQVNRGPRKAGSKHAPPAVLGTRLFVSVQLTGSLNGVGLPLAGNGTDYPAEPPPG